MRSISEIVMVFTTGNEAAGAFAGQAKDWLAGRGRRVRVVEYVVTAEGGLFWLHGCRATLQTDGADFLGSRFAGR